MNDLGHRLKKVDPGWHGREPFRDCEDARRNCYKQQDSDICERLNDA